MKMREKPLNFDLMSDLELAHYASCREEMAVRIITERNNQRMFRAAWSVVRNHADAEDVVQDAYLKAFSSIGNFAGQSSLATWLTRIVINTALDRQRAANRRREELLEQDVAMLDQYKKRHAYQDGRSPEAELLRSELSGLLKVAISKLSDEFRPVFVLRDIEGMSVRETADALGINEATVKTRLLRARRKLRIVLEPEFKSVAEETLPFAGADCQAMTKHVLVALKI